MVAIPPNFDPVNNSDLWAYKMAVLQNFRTLLAPLHIVIASLAENGKATITTLWRPEPGQP
jgi:hypothetical protein